jgi:hypothetical protein
MRILVNKHDSKIVSLVLEKILVREAYGRTQRVTSMPPDWQSSGGTLFYKYTENSLIVDYIWVK